MVSNDLEQGGSRRDVNPYVTTTYVEFPEIRKVLHFATPVSAGRVYQLSRPAASKIVYSQPKSAADYFRENSRLAAIEWGAGLTYDDKDL